MRGWLQALGLAATVLSEKEQRGDTVWLGGVLQLWRWTELNVEATRVQRSGIGVG
jgi:hypothetical protein